MDNALYAKYKKTAEVASRRTDRTDDDRKSLGIANLHNNIYTLGAKNISLSEGQSFDEKARKEIGALSVTRYLYSLGNNEQTRADADLAEFKKLLLTAKDSEVYKKRYEALNEESTIKQKKWFAEANGILEKAGKNARRISRDQIVRIIDDAKKAIAREDRIRDTRDALMECPEFSDKKEELLDFFRLEINFSEFVSESTMACLRFIASGQQTGYLQGSYIYRHWGIPANRLSQKKTFSAQLFTLDESFLGLTEYELDTFPFAMLLEKKMENKKQEGSMTYEDIKKEYSFLCGEKERLHELFEEPGILKIFIHITDMIVLFDRLKTLREAICPLLGTDEDHREELFEMYSVCSAMYNTLMIRHRGMVSASRLTPGQLIAEKPSYKTADYDYCLREQRNVVNRYPERK